MRKTNLQDNHFYQKLECVYFNILYLCYMEKNLFKYIEFLLPQYNCVIIPDFGGFVVNIEPAYFDQDGAVIPPSYRISFNEDLKYNDGLLASNIQRSENISYESACHNIKRVVEEIRKSLAAHKSFVCNNLGKIILNEEGNLSFIPNNSNTYPYLMGLSSVRIPLLSQIDNDRVREKKTISLRYIIGGATAAAVALLLFMGPSAKVGNITDSTNRQQANFIHTLTTSQRYIAVNSGQDTASTYVSEYFVAEQEIEDAVFSSAAEETTDVNGYKQYQNNSVPERNIRIQENYIAETPAATVVSRTYYIIVGGEESKYQAERLLYKIQSEDFPSANIVESADRYRIYVSAFGNKPEAEKFLEKFRSENPRYSTAWLFSKRN